MSPDFLLNYLAVGPIRFRIPESTESTLPIMVESRMMDVYPVELVELAEKARTEYEGTGESDSKNGPGPVGQGQNAGRTDLRRWYHRDAKKSYLS
jgi:hypothetical protein